MKKNIAVVYGGYSAEFPISVQSGEYVASIIDRNKFNVFEILLTKEEWKLAKANEKIDKNDFSFTYNNEKIKIDLAVILIHGNPGEDGILQSYLDLVNIPYTTCNTLTASLTFNKFFCNNYLRNYNIKMAKSFVLRENDSIEKKLNPFLNEVGFPVFIKPNEGGSSFGTYKVKGEGEVSDAIKSAFEHSDEVIIEEFIEGREITCGVVKVDGKITAFTPCEVVSKNEFFDFEAKYNSELNEEIIPARFDKKILDECQNLSIKIYDILNCKGIVRVDFIEKNDELYFLEVNTIPGMTSESLVPKMIRYDKIDITDMMTKLILESL